MSGKRCESCKVRQGNEYQCPKCKEKKYFCICCVGLCQKCTKRFERTKKIQNSVHEDKTKIKKEQVHRLGARQQKETTQVLRNFRSIDPVRNRSQKQPIIGKGRDEVDLRKDYQLHQIKNLRRDDIKFKNLESMAQRNFQQKSKPLDKNNPLKKDNYVKPVTHAEQLARQKQIEEVKRQVKINKGYKHSGCNIVHKLYELAKVLDESRKQSEFVYIPGCGGVRESKEFLIEILKNRCIQCGKGNVNLDSFSNELKNGCYLCFSCERVKISDKQMANYIESLFYRCVSCEYNHVKRKRKEMHIVQGQDANQLMVCNYCFKGNEFQEKRFQRIAEQEKKHQKQQEQQQMKMGMKKYHNEILEREYEKNDYRQRKQLLHQAKSHIREKQVPVNNYRKQQSLPKKLQEKPAVKYQYKPPRTNNFLMEDYGLNKFDRVRNFWEDKKPVSKQQKCIVCETLTVQPVIVDGLVICNGCKAANKEELEKKEEQINKNEANHKFQDKKIQIDPKIGRGSLNKQIYDRNLNQNRSNIKVQQEKPNFKTEEFRNQKDSIEPQKVEQKVKQQTKQQFSFPQKKDILPKIQQSQEQAKKTQALTIQDSKETKKLKKYAKVENQVQFKCMQCGLVITEMKNIGLVTQNDIVLCRECKIRQTQQLVKVPVSKSIKEQKSSIHEDLKSESRSMASKIQSVEELDQSQILSKAPKPQKVQQKVQSQLSILRKRFQQPTLKPAQEVKPQEKLNSQQKKSNKLQEVKKQDGSIYSHSMLKSQISSRKSFVIPTDPRQQPKKRHQVEYSDILTDSIINELKNKSFSNHESLKEKEKSNSVLEEHTLSEALVFDPKELLVPTNDTVEEKPFVTPVSAIRKRQNPKGQDQRLTSTQFQNLHSLVTSMDQSEKKIVSYQKQQLSSDYIKQTFNQFEQEEVIKNQKIDIKLQDLEKSSSIKLLNCNLCHLMVEESKGFLIDQKQQRGSSPQQNMFMCQSCYYKQHFEMKQAEQTMRRSKVEKDKRETRQKMQSMEKKSPFRSLRIEDDLGSKRSPATIRAFKSASKPYSQIEKMSSAKPSYGYGIAGIGQSMYSNTSQRMFLEQKLVKTQKQYQNYRQEPILKATEEFIKNPVSKSEMMTESTTASKQNICTLCKKESTILCFEKYCLECFKRQK